VIGPINILLAIIFLLLVPYVLGLLLEKQFLLIGESFLISRTFILGFITMLVSFWIIAVPCILIGTSFTTLFYLWCPLLVLLLALSLFFNRRELMSQLKNGISGIIKTIKESDRERKILIYVFLIIIIFQTSLLVFKMHTDTDDSRFLAEALEAVENNTLLRVHPINGKVLEAPIGEMRKDVLSPYPIFIAALSVLTRLHPTVLAHSVFPIFLIPLSYVSMFVLGNYFFGNTKKRTIFMYILSFVLMFSYESLYSLGYTLLTIIWQGRSTYVMCLLAFSWYILMKIYTESPKKELYLIFFMTSLASQCLSGTGGLVQVLLAIGFAISYVVTNKKLVPAIMIGVCVIPCGIALVFYKIY